MKGPFQRLTLEPGRDPAVALSVANHSPCSGSANIRRDQVRTWLYPPGVKRFPPVSWCRWPAGWQSRFSLCGHQNPHLSPIFLYGLLPWWSVKQKKH
jgi:hypothetical protein